MHLHTATHIHKHLEMKFYKEQLLDANAVELKFKARIDTSQPLEEYFDHQQQWQDHLKDTKESILQISMKHTFIGYLQKIPYIVRNVRDYK